MEDNLLLEQYSRYKKISLKESPFKCLLNADIELNPHQINAFIAAIQALKTGGIVLADEVGLGKTIEAGLVLNYVLDSGLKKVLIALPATLRKQWEVELEEKFGKKATILDRISVEKDYYGTKKWIEANEVRIIITSYDYASKLIQRFPKVKWDFIIIDEAHNLRNVFHGTKRAKNLYDLTTGIPKILLTATPLQNSLSDLHGLISFIDPKIFGSEDVFSRRFIEGQDYDELKRELHPVLFRTLRKDVGKYMDFKRRKCITVDFHLSKEETELYELVNAFLKRDYLYSSPLKNKGLIILVIRKLLASSSFALVQTFEVLQKRLKNLYQGTKSANAQEGFDLFWEFVEDEIDDSDVDETEDLDITIQKQAIQDEIDAVQAIIDIASSISSNAKVEALKTALSTAFLHQQKAGMPLKAVVFTESKRTQKYISGELRKSGYSEEDILLFNGDFDDTMSKQIFHSWQVKNFRNTNYGRNVEYKHAIVDYFKSHAKVLIVTDAGSEGLNLQFCNTVINYDLPWNPQKIEQRIGRCHRYGQINDVIAINLLNTDNEADKRVYDILSRKFELFEGVFGASDIALGVLESGIGFEKKVLEIYQECSSSAEFKDAFDILDDQLTSKMNKQMVKLKSILLTESEEAKGEALDRTSKDIKKYLADVEYWDQFNEPEIFNELQYWKIDNWGEENFLSHGTLFVGAFCNNNIILFPVLLLCDEDGNYIDFTEQEIVQALEKADDGDIRYFTPTKEENEMYKSVYKQLTNEMIERYRESVEPIKEYHRNKINNWVRIQTEQLILHIEELSTEVEDLLIQEMQAQDSLQKSDILRKVGTKKKQLDMAKKNQQYRIERFNKEAEEEICSFNQQFEINPILLVNVVLKF